MFGPFFVLFQKRASECRSPGRFYPLTLPCCGTYLQGGSGVDVQVQVQGDSTARDPAHCRDQRTRVNVLKWHGPRAPGLPVMPNPERAFTRWRKRPGLLFLKLLDWHAMFAGRHFASQILEIGYNLVNSSACCNDPRNSPVFRQTSKRSFNSDEAAVVARIAVRRRAPPLTTDDDDERRTTQDGRQSR